MKLISRVSELRPLAKTQKTMNDAARVGLDAGMRSWIDTFLPGHFERSAHGKYGYESRTRKWNERKAKRKYVKSWLLGGAFIRAPRPVRDNVYSGDAMALVALPSSRFRIVPRATANNVSVSTGINLNRGGAKGGRPFLRDTRFFEEVTRVGPDAQAVADVVVAVTSARLLDNKG